MPTIDPRPRINLLPLTDAQRETFAAAVRLVLANPTAFAGAVRWLESDYSVEAYRKRHEHQWEAHCRSEEKSAQCAPSVEEIAGGTYSVPTSWYSKRDADGNIIEDANGETVFFSIRKVTTSDEPKRRNSPRNTAYCRALNMQSSAVRTNLSRLKMSAATDGR
jgi:hypothetical protein